MALDLELDEQLPVLRLDIGPNLSGQSVPVVVSLPVDPPDKDEDEEEEEERRPRRRRRGRR